MYLLDSIHTRSNETRINCGSSMDPYSSQWGLNYGLPLMLKCCMISLDSRLASYIYYNSIIMIFLSYCVEKIKKMMRYTKRQSEYL